MPNMIYTNGKQLIRKGINRLRVMLTTEGYEPSIDHTDCSDVTHEVCGEGYLKGGREAPRVREHECDGVITVCCDPICWPQSTITDACYAVFYVPSEGLVCVYEFDKPTSSVCHEFVIDLPDGIVSM